MNFIAAPSAGKHGVVIVGAGQAGASCAANLRQAGFPGPISLIGEEVAAPYQRPPLSKAWLLGKCTDESIEWKPRSFYAQQDIDLFLGARVERLDRTARCVVLTDGREFPYDYLVIATGARARRMAWVAHAATRLHELRTSLDATRFKASLRPGSTVLIIGAGYIGLEAAASARALGAEVTVIERETRVLARVACRALSDYFEDHHRRHGVSFLFNRSVCSIDMESNGVHRVEIDGGEQLHADTVLVGVGAVPNQELADTAGLECQDGILVDERACTSDKDIYAIGDCARRPISLYGQRWRLESVPNALEQAKQAAAAICGGPLPAEEVPWFWSDQYDTKLQIAGLPIQVARLVVRGDAAEGRFAVFHLNDRQQVQAVEAVNAAPEFLMGRRLIAARRTVNVERLCNSKISMKEVAV